MKMRITKRDVKESGEYIDCKNCLVATMLRRRGHAHVNVSGFSVYTNRGRFIITNAMNITQLYGDYAKKVRKSAIGKTIELVQQSRAAA